jgi:PIN domain
VCLIIDTNVIHRVFPSATADHRPVHKALASLRATMVYGGELRREYVRMAWFRAFLLRLDQTGAAKVFSDAEVDAQTERIRHAGGYRSDDPHILALAIVTNARLLCSEDDDLSRDFTNGAIIRSPRGSVYRRANQAHLLRRHCRGQAG